MACENGLNCLPKNAIIVYDPIPGQAALWDEGTVVEFDPEDLEIEVHTDHTGTLSMASGKDIKQVLITLTLFPCSDWYKALFLAWKANGFICGRLVVNHPCCDPYIFEDVRVSSMGLFNISYDPEPITLVFLGTLV